MFTLKKVLKVLKRKSRTTRGRVEFLNNLDYDRLGVFLEHLSSTPLGNNLDYLKILHDLE